MLPHPTLERLTGMGFTGMARAFGELATNAEADRLTHPEWLALLLDREWSFRHDRTMPRDDLNRGQRVFGTGC